jgi:hypothetical protein
MEDQMMTKVILRAVEAIIIDQLQSLIKLQNPAQEQDHLQILGEAQMEVMLHILHLNLR